MEEDCQVGHRAKHSGPSTEAHPHLGKDAPRHLSVQPPLPRAGGREEEGEPDHLHLEGRRFSGIALTMCGPWRQPGGALGLGKLFKISSAWVNLCPQRGDSTEAETRFQPWVHSPLLLSLQSWSRTGPGSPFR